MENTKLIQGKDIEININIRTFWKVPTKESITETIKESKIPKYYSIYEIDIDLPEKVTTIDDEMKMDNEKDGSISLKLIDAKYKVREKNEHDEMTGVIEALVYDLDTKLKDMGILFTVWSCAAIE